MRRSLIAIVTPYSAQANNGNWRTASRWARLLRDRFHVIVQAPGDGLPRDGADCLIALHARRSHDHIVAWRASHPDRPLIVVLTGTDLYRDLPDDACARESLRLADRLVVLQEDAVRRLPQAVRAKARVVFQSAPRLAPAAKPGTRLNAVVVGHLRAEKDPATALAAWHHLPEALPLHLRLIGAPLDPALARLAAEAGARDPRCRWVGPMPHAATRQAIKRAHVLIVPSLMEGGANVIAEAVTAGTPVLASRMSGNLGMLGRDYAGYFPVGDAAALARLLRRCRDEPAFLRGLAQQCRARAALFAPARERAALTGLLRELRCAPASPRVRGPG
jgi:putative glycosyltransferase (TIGR04348 family)